MEAADMSETTELTGLNGLSGAKVLTSAAAILGIQDTKTEKVYVPQWGVYVYVKAMTGEERDTYENSLWQGKGKNREVNVRNARAKLVALTVVDESGNRVFRDSDAHALGQKNAGALDTIYDVAARLAGITDDDLEELGKPSEGGLNGSSTSA